MRHVLVCLTHRLYCFRLVCEIQLRVGMSSVCIWKIQWKAWLHILDYMGERRSCLNGKISFFTHLVAGRIVKIAIGFQGLLHYKEWGRKNPKPSVLPPETTLVSHKIYILCIFLEQVCPKLCFNAKVFHQMPEVFSPYNKCFLKKKGQHSKQFLWIFFVDRPGIPRPFSYLIY